MNEKINNKIINTALYFLIIAIPLAVSCGIIWVNPLFTLNISQSVVPKVICFYAVCILLLICIILRKDKLKADLIDKIILAFGGLAVVSTIFAFDKNWAILGAFRRNEGLLAILGFILVYYATKHYFKYKKTFPNIVLIVTSIVCLFAIVQSYVKVQDTFIYPFLTIKLNPIFNNGSMGTFGNINFMGSFISIILPIMMGTYILTGKKKWAFGMTLAFTVMILCATRSSWVAFAFVSLIGLIYLIKMKDKELFKRACIMIICFICSFVFVITTCENNAIVQKLKLMVSEIKEAATDGINEDMGSFRIEIWNMTVKAIEKHPLIGCGPDNLALVFSEEMPKENAAFIEKRGVYADKAHNEYLQYAATLGIPAAILYIAFIILILKRGVKNISANKGTFIILLGIIGYLIQAFFNISVIGVAPIFWFALGLIQNEEAIKSINEEIQ